METDEELEARFQKWLRESPEGRAAAALRDLQAALRKELKPHPLTIRFLAWLDRQLRRLRRKAREEE